MSGAASGKERLDFLDGARGLAALLVLAEHGLAASLPDFLKSTPVGHGNLGKAGVLLFLLISGFIIPASLEQGGSNTRFWLRRFCRLFPAYWLSIAVAFCCCSFGGKFVPSLAPGDWFLNLTMLQGFFGRPHVWGVFWTLQLELVIYVACSLLFAVRLLRWSSCIAGLALGGYAVAGLARPLLEGHPFDIGGLRLLFYAPLAGFMAQRCLAGRFGARTLLAWGVGQWCVLAAVWTVNHLMFPAETTPEGLWEFARAWGTAYACFFLLLATRHRRLPPTACWFGRISYSVYLLHPFVLEVLQRANLPAWVFLPTLLLCTLLLAELAYRLVELPGIALGRAIERRWMPVTTQTTPMGIPVRRAA